MRMRCFSPCSRIRSLEYPLLRNGVNSKIRVRPFTSFAKSLAIHSLYLDHALRECHQLREVAVGFQLRDGTVPWVENVLTSLNSPELRELRLKVTSSELLVHLRGKKSSKSLSQIDKALVGLLFRSPGELKVFIDIPVSHRRVASLSEVTTQMQKRFPKCMARGILNFRYF